MGSFSSTCCVSGLPIGAGDEVYYLLLTKNPYSDESLTCETTGLWFPRTWPIKAKYNDYGSVEQIESKPEQDLWLEMFKQDLVEKGVGDNTVHDVAINKDCSFDDILEALWERRVEVLQYKDWDKEPEIPEWEPTIQKVQSILDMIPLEKGCAFLVDNDPGYLRVRWKGAGEEYGKDLVWLNKAMGLLETKFATVITASNLQTMAKAELRVFMAPGTYSQGPLTIPRHNVNFGNHRAPLSITQGMIRKDVWDALCTVKLKSRWDWDCITLETYEQEIQALVNHLDEMGLEVIESLLNRFPDTLREIAYVVPEYRGKPTLAYVLSTAIPYTVGLADHFYAAYKAGLCKDPAFIRKVAEFSFIQHLFHYMCYVWRPSYPIGPQCPEWDMFAPMHKAIGKVVVANIKAEREERKKWR